MTSKKSQTSGSFQVPNPQTVISTRWKHQVAFFVVFNVSDSIVVTIVDTSLLEELWFKLDCWVEVNQRNLLVFTTNHKQVSARMSTNWSASVHSIWFISLWRAEFSVRNQLFLGGTACNIKNTLISCANYVFLIVGEFTTNHDWLWLWIFENWCFSVSHIIQANLFITTTSSDIGWISIPWSIISLFEDQY